MEAAIRLGYLTLERGLSREYDCEFCRSRGKDAPLSKDNDGRWTGRACFRFRTEDNVARCQPHGRSYVRRGRQSVERLTRSEVWRRVEQLRAFDRKATVMDHLRKLGVCPQGMVEPVHDIVAEEMVCETYKTQPVGGGVEDWPALKYDAFMVIRQTHQQCKIEAMEKRIKSRE